jgi:hypothetical protein
MVAFERDALGFRIEAKFTTLTKAATTRARLVMASSPKRGLGKNFARGKS